MYNDCKKAQAYLLVTFLLAAFIFAAIFSIRMASQLGSEGTFEIENLKRELPEAYSNGIYNNDLNYTMSHTSEQFLDFYASKRLTLKLLFVAYDKNGHYVLGNYWGEDCNYHNSAISGIVHNGSTHLLSKETLLNDYSLIFCGVNFNLKNNFKYRAELRRGEEVIAK